jgi:hypothetical protein
LAVGEWTDGRNFWFFQALVESAKLDIMCENSHNLLIQSGVILSQHAYSGPSQTPSAQPTTATTETIPVGGVIDVGGFIVEFNVEIFDSCPWNRLRVSTHVREMVALGGIGTGGKIRLYRHPGLGTSAAWTQVAEFYEDISPPGRRVSLADDISGLVQGLYGYRLQAWEGLSGILDMSQIAIQLVNTVTGVSIG